MAITVHLDLTISHDSVPEAASVIHAILADTRAFPGCLGVDVLEDVRNPAHLLLVERWESVEADAAYRAWRAGDGASNLGTILAAPPVLTAFATRGDI